ncbi:MAG: hypothetical protein RM347_023280 [Nostoc sp. ChiQUE02]|uniref:hypothetical protein n=1 Tax=Nostoc sp. ChiQUE02 TaxID=3075377 RepID=UPI002AD3AD4C|nr:hypothetical protein [Nostoc sp. ChiQUE02]MDZ8234089.1 hypothetical protein [Nostoc sp. ChiQUE02]
MLSKLKTSKILQENLILYTTIISSLFCIVLLVDRFLLDNFAAPGQYISSEPEWNADRLAMAFFLKYKFHLYYPEDSVGPLISDMYGPLLALAYLPATIANSPTFALILAKLISLGFYFIPVIWLYVSETWQKKNLSLSILALVAFFFFTTNIRTLFYDAFRICADCPALGFSALACIIIYRETNKNQISLAKLLISAILAVLAVWTKQIAIPILISLPLYIFLAYDIKTFKRYLACLFISGVVISGVLIIAFNPQALLFNIITIPGHQPWDGGDNKIIVLLSAAEQLAGYCLLQGIIVGFWILFTVPNDITKIKTWIQENPWLLFFIVSLFFIPTSLLGRVKVGGDANGMYTVYFLTITANLVLLKQASNLLKESGQEILQRIGKTWLLTIVIMFTIYNINLPISRIFKTLPNFFRNVHQVVYEYSQKNPGKVYFPWHPLSVLMAENKLYHIDSGPLDRYLAGYPISKDDFMAYIPENLTMIAIPAWADTRGEYGKFYLHYLPDFTRKVEIPELSGFIIYTKELEN